MEESNQLSALSDQLKTLMKEHGEDAVYEEMMKILRRDCLGIAAMKFNLLPHIAESVKTEGRQN